MDVGFCPECKKAGLKYNDPQGLDVDGRNSVERYNAAMTGKSFSIYGSYKWCHRCKKWVKPTYRNVMAK